MFQRRIIQHRYRLLQVANQNLAQRVAWERQPLRTQLVQDDTDGVDIGAGVDALAVYLLGRHVVRRADERAGAGQLDLLRGLKAHDLGDAEVDDLEQRRSTRFLDDKDVVRLEIAVDDADRVRCRQTGAQLAHQRRDLGQGQATRLHALTQRAALQVLHDVVLAAAFQLADVEDVDEVDVANAADEPRLLQKARGRILLAHHLAAQDLDGGLVAQGAVLGGIDHAHATLADQRDDAVLADRLADQRVLATCHCRSSQGEGARWQPPPRPVRRPRWPVPPPGRHLASAPRLPAAPRASGLVPAEPPAR